MNESSDNLDIAAELQQLLNDAGLEKIRRLAAPETHPDFDGKHCLECDEPIPAARLKLFKVRCILCQTLKEKRDRR